MDTFAPIALTRWPDPAPWIALRLDWARQWGACWMIPPEDAKAAWLAMPALLRPKTPDDFAHALLVGVQNALQGPGAPLEGFLALTFDTASQSSTERLVYAEICSGRLAPNGFDAESAKTLMGGIIEQSFPRAAQIGLFQSSADRSAGSPRSHWEARIPETQALIETLDLRSVLPAASRKGSPSL
jgi:hypothetical protein